MLARASRGERSIASDSQCHLLRLVPIGASGAFGTIGIGMFCEEQAAFADDTQAATVHFIRYGHGEGRSDEPTQAAADFLL